MNRHFLRDTRWDGRSFRAFARVDHVVPPDPGSESVLWALDAIDAEWLERLGGQDPRFDLKDPDGVVAAWSKAGLWHRFEGPHQSPFERAPIYRIEVDFPSRSAPLGLLKASDYQDRGTVEDGLGALERYWFDLSLSRDANGGAEARVYSGLFADAVLAYVVGKMPSVQQGRALSAIFSLGNLPTISTAELEQRLEISSADYLAVFDVGQGNCNALLKEESSARARPSMYYDLGAGVYRNRHTTPSSLVFCFSQSPPIVLSHWDADHWAGAYVSSVGGTYPALAETWIAPLQSTGPVHIAFAHDVLAHGGSIVTYSPAPRAVGEVSLTPVRQLRFAVGNGSDRNNTGIVLAIENTDLIPPRSWLLTGDCDYAFFISHLAPLPPVALVVPHHGATLSQGSPVPAPIKSVYRRIIYSFGAGNLHGPTNVQHPTPAGVTLHASAGWQHGAWSPSTPGSCIATADVLETEIHGIAGGCAVQLGGCVAEWSCKPPVVVPPCGLTSCSTAITRS